MYQAHDSGPNRFELIALASESIPWLLIASLLAEEIAWIFPVALSSTTRSTYLLILNLSVVICASKDLL